MNRQDTQQFAKLMAAIGELYEKKISTQLLDIYFQTLKRFSFADVSSAVNAHVNNADSGQFFPKPADLIRQLEGTSDSKAMIAWGDVMKAIRQVGSYDGVEFIDRRITAVIADMGGWINLCATKECDMPFKARDFHRRYKALENVSLEGRPNYLPGKFSTGKPVLIGELKNNVVELSNSPRKTAIEAPRSH